jgi:hypothetical protein
MYRNCSSTIFKWIMSTLKKTCPSCGRLSGVPLVYGDYEHLEATARIKIDLGEIVCAGDAITIDERGRPMDIGCLECRAQWWDEPSDGPYAIAIAVSGNLRDGPKENATGDTKEDRRNTSDSELLRDSAYPLDNSHLTVDFRDANVRPAPANTSFSTKKHQAIK